ncbi:apolipoprotein N-acetyltransferase [Chlamydia felis Fe/C-56]|uniref:Apolipoprotein N-acyltransferase n=1 Tax=Chlamydia felis (strain Fe/C-56) TaxID=264202 RepID=Q252U7_CHLFF|nr:apolipoprotein N-acyltransferase [Chlamydia felis]BAE81691.1 apolipoprotein N-acetyltransferase [Chlamydia felis Fe/C-56]
MFRILSFFCSWILVAFAQPDMSWVLSLLGGAVGYGLLWYSLEPLKNPRLSWKLLILLLFLWSVTIHGAHFSWMLSDLYVGKFIYLVWCVLTSLLAALFTAFSCLLFYVVRKKYVKIFWCLPGLWVGMEMIRFYYLCSGMSLDYLGWPITACAYGRQFGGFFGWAGESFALVATGMSFYHVLLKKRFSRLAWLICLLFPYILGGIHYEYLKRTFSTEENLRVAIIQPASSTFLDGPWSGSPAMAWQKLVSLSSIVRKPVDLLIFPEVSVPFGRDRRVYPYEDSQEILSPLTCFNHQDDLLTNIDWMQALSNHFNCPILMGLERWEEREAQLHLYNAAECISQHGEPVGYDKRVLVPGGEYIPGGKFGWSVCKKYFPEYALACQRIPGERSGVMQVENLPKMGVSICYEETFGSLLRHYKQEGAQLLVNLSNDGWYPSSRLPQVHFYHGILRNQELGMPCIRSCHTGVTVAADSIGRIVNMLPYETRSRKASPGVLQVDLPLYNYPTLYAFWGDFPMILLSLLSVGYIGCYFGYRLLAKKEKG